MNRRAFVLSVFAFLLSACAVGRVPKPESDPDAEFHAWLKKKRRYRDFNTLDEAKSAYDKEIDDRRKEREWREYRKMHGLR